MWPSRLTRDEPVMAFLGCQIVHKAIFGDTKNIAVRALFDSVGQRRARGRADDDADRLQSGGVNVVGARSHRSRRKHVRPFVMGGGAGRSGRQHRIDEGGEKSG